MGRLRQLSVLFVAAFGVIVGDAAASAGGADQGGHPPVRGDFECTAPESYLLQHLQTHPKGFLAYAFFS